MAIEKRKRGGKTYLYYKHLHDSTYLGTPQKPKKGGIRKALRHCQQRKASVDPDIQFLEKLRRKTAQN